MDRSDEYYEGYEAFALGMTDADNPYAAGTDEGMDWFDGLADAENDHYNPPEEGSAKERA
ncbi:hypothetical protein H1O16_gp330 [Burkholderia phage BcepSaruman]|uniref:Uncharacterized protein n=1 Tax=Burkholderia phage BcepSaruman TaxID=2530032 RepID=A0A4D5ZCH0_9CAUD|nr:hypothetical protein H1O16_gp330 [Burkholderia phage BcepSaruman]QBX06743.1 hypothetical protein BcepSaruman_330 [Burkholderia phage BcepSaruman]